MSTGHRHHHRRGFTLLELLVVIGIVVLLISIALPMALRARKNANETRVRMDLQSIGIALDQYKSDHGDYPRLMEHTAGTDEKDKHQGAVLLVQAMIAPDAATKDGADGPGFRVRGTQGKVWGPYIPVDKFKIGLVSPDGGPLPLADPPVYEAAVLFDNLEKRILYFPARPGKPDISQANMFIAEVRGTGAKPLYNYADNTTIDDINVFRTFMGDADNNGAINAGEKAAYTGPFILWTPGVDGQWGTADDITNYDR